jgi:NAD dependent epimerase/dehydratase family enzyme
VAVNIGGTEETGCMTLDSSAPLATRRAVLAGASGFIGGVLRRELVAEGYEVRLIGRSVPAVGWHDTEAIDAAIDGASLVINLAGKSVNCRYTESNRAEIRRSRVDTTRILRESISRVASPPALWLNSSTATIYRHAEDRPQTESTGEIGTGFSVSIATDWEDAFFAGELAQTRRVALRMAIVLGRGGALTPLVRIARLGLGGTQHDGWWFRSLFGSAARRRAGVWHEKRGTKGLQKFSWVHIDDVVAIVRFIRDRPNIDGVVNVCAPEPSDNRRLMALLRRNVGAPVGLPARRWMLELAMWVLRTETELVLKSRWVVPERLQNAGYVFRHGTLEQALDDLARPAPAATR